MARYYVVDKRPPTFFAGLQPDKPSCETTSTFKLNSQSNSSNTSTTAMSATSRLPVPPGADRTAMPTVSGSATVARALSPPKLLALFLVLVGYLGFCEASTLDIIGPKVGSHSPRTYHVNVGDSNKTTFDPNQIAAAFGDVVRFRIVNDNHSVTQSSIDHPCRNAGAFDSTLFQAKDHSRRPIVVDLIVITTTPQYFFSRQISSIDCPLTEIFVVNPDQEHAAAAQDICGSSSSSSNAKVSHWYSDQVSNSYDHASCRRGRSCSWLAPTRSNALLTSRALPTSRSLSSSGIGYVTCVPTSTLQTIASAAVQEL
ncbi:hypothetical protein LTR09_012932 [Extremus antarcticus]|uniref:Uncharacterized protein n=1 Tax=Extremus antarcticus TaxID=702011 RepID=A0AAJ0D4I3_9PEZI|nr:hypothetical protein LTR09_012932 [Extremus antarcticus]